MVNPVSTASNPIAPTNLDLTAPPAPADSGPPAGNPALGSIAPKQRDALADRAIQWFARSADVSVDKPTDSASRLTSAQQVFLALQDKARENPSARNLALLNEYGQTLQDIGELGKGAVNYGLRTGATVNAPRSIEALTLGADSDMNGKLSRQELQDARANTRAGTTERRALDAALTALDEINDELGAAGDGTLSRQFVTDALRSKLIDGDFSNDNNAKPKQPS
jgi:hypothetical protein